MPRTARTPGRAGSPRRLKPRRGRRRIRRHGRGDRRRVHGPRIDLFLNHHVYAVARAGRRIAAVTAFDTRTSARRFFRGRNYVDATGHGTVGFLAGADTTMTPKGRTVPVHVEGAPREQTLRIDMRKAPDKPGRIVLGSFRFTAGARCWVEIGTAGAGGFVHADAIQVVPGKR